jgi:hypothetical protein
MSPTFRIRTVDAANLLDGVVSMNLGQMAKSRYGAPGHFPILRGIQRGTVRYRRADPDEHWKTWRELMEELEHRGRAFGDCEDLASAVAAEMLYNGTGARTYVYKSAPKLYHVVVKTDRWGLLDPSRAAGMEGNG